MAKLGKLHDLIGKSIKTRFQGDSKLYVFGCNKQESVVLCLWKYGIARIKQNHITEVINN